MLRCRHSMTRTFLPLLVGRGVLHHTTASASSPLRRFIEQIVGGRAALSDTPAVAVSDGGDPASLTVHFLRHSCGLAEAEAAAVAARLRLRSTKNAHAVLAVLRDLGFPPASVARLVTSFPAVLSSTTFGAKLEFYRHDLGLSDAEIRRFLLASPQRTITAGLDGRLRSNRQLLRDLLGTDKNVLTAVKQSMELIYDNLEVLLLPKLKVLRDYGVTEEVLVKLVTTHPKALVHRSARFEEALIAMKDLGVSPRSGIFPYAFGVFAKMYDSKWQCRMENYISLGWTEDQVRRAYVRHPYCMSVSEDKVRLVMRLLTEKLGWTPEYVSSSPTVLSFSYEKRLFPRCAVLDILNSKGIINNSIKLHHLMMTERKFKEKYVTRYQQVAPQVLEAYEATATSVK